MATTGDPTVSFPGWELQQDEYSILNGNSTIKTTLGCKVYDEPPHNATFPYIVVGEHVDVTNYNKSSAIHEITSVFHVCSEYRGAKEVQLIIDAMAQALTGGSYSLTGFTVIQVSLDDSAPILREQDGDRVLRHGVPRFRYLIS